MEPADVIDLLKKARVMDALAAIDKVQDKKRMAELLTEFAGALNYLKGQPQISEALLLKSLNLNETALVHYNLGVLYSSPDSAEKDPANIDLAIEHFKRAKRIDPHFIESRYNLGLLYYFIGRADDAEREYLQIMKLVGDRRSERRLGSLILEKKRIKAYYGEELPEDDMGLFKL